MVCVTRILRTLIHDVGTTSSVVAGQIPICLPTQFICHKNGQAPHRLKRGQFPYTCYTRKLCLCVLFHQERMGKGRHLLSGERNRGLWGIKLKLKHKRIMNSEGTGSSLFLYSQDIEKCIVSILTNDFKGKNKQTFSRRNTIPLTY